MKSLTIYSEKPVRVVYEVQSFTLDGELLARRFFRTKRRAERMMNMLKKQGYEASLRRLCRSEWKWVNPADIEREEKINEN